MKVLFVHNEYIKPSDEEAASGELARLMDEHGHEVRWFRKSSADIHGLKGKAKAFFLGIYNPVAERDLAEVLDEFRPDAVQIQDLYPFISISIFKPLKQRGIPVVMRCPNYRLFCPDGLCLDLDGNVCEKCFGKGKEFWCASKNCEGSRQKSIGYALRDWFARRSRAILDGVDAFIVQSDFQKRKYAAQGIPPAKLHVVPGIAPSVEAPKEWHEGTFVSFVGRVSQEKGIDEFIEAARMNPDIQFKVAGNIDSSYHVPKDLSSNIEFVGFLKGKDLDDFYLDSRIIVVPSKWYEGFPNVIVRGMLLGRPIITTDIGAMQSIIRNGENGILVPPADGIALGEAINLLYNDVDKCKVLSLQAIKDTSDNYSREKIYMRTSKLYHSLGIKENTPPLSNSGLLKLSGYMLATAA